jgi:hypothetical protein
MDYISAVRQGVSLSDWLAIIKRAAADAKNGDAAARAWVGKMLVGDNPALVFDLMGQLQAEITRFKTQFPPNGYGVPVPDGARCVEAMTPPCGPKAADAKPASVPADPVQDDVTLPPLLFP